MEEPNWTEIYNQRYETFRHLDGLRWQMLQLGVGAPAIVVAFGNGSGQTDWWLWGCVGLVLIFCGIAMIRIGAGIQSNAVVLSEAGSKIGDDGIPVPSNRLGSVSFWIAVTMVLIGVAIIASQIWRG